MKSFKLELRVYDSNTIRWQVFLEEIAENNMIKNWRPPSDGRDYFSKTWTEYKIDDESLEVYVACSGYGGTAQCIVLIDDARPSKKNSIFSSFDDTRVATKSFPI